jgi:hypothetical protein
MFYQLMCVLQDEETQKKGIVSVVYASLTDSTSQERARPNTQLLLKIIRLGRAIPMTIRGRHMCTSDKLHTVFFSYYSSFMRKDVRMRSRVHSGTG